MELNRTKILQYGLTLVVLLGIGWTAAQYLNGEALLMALEDFDYRLLPATLLLSAGALVTKGWRFVVLARPVTDARWGLLLRAYIAGRPASLVPGGVAARIAFLQQAGIDGGKGASPVFFDSAMDQAFLIPIAVLVAFWFPQARLPLAIGVGIIGLLGLTLLIPASRRHMGRLVEAITRKLNLTRSWQDFLASSQDLLTPRTMGSAYILTGISFGMLVAVLVLALWGLDLNVAYHEAFMAVILSNLAGRILPIPGGVGVTEASLVGFLVITAGVDENMAAAATTVYRIATLLWQALLGAVVYFFAWNGKKENAG